MATERSVLIRLRGITTDFTAAMGRAGASVKDLRQEIDKATKTEKGRAALNDLAGTAAGVGVAMVAGFGLATGAAARFEKQMSSVDAATDVSAAQMDLLRDAALRAGKDTAFSATEAAQGIEELAKAGIGAADILGGGLSGALDLAASGQIEVAMAAETAASAMTQFGLAGKDVPHIADLLSAAAGKAQGNVQDMAAALNMGGLVAAQMGLSIEEATGTLAAFASAGLLGSDSGTSFKTMLLRLAAPTDVAAAKMRELGINAFDAQGEFVGMAKFAGILQTALGGMTDEQRNAAMSVIFGADAIRAASIVYQQGERGIAGWIEQVDESGHAADTAATKTDNLMGDVERLTGSLETLAIESGTGATSGLRTLTQGAENLVSSLGQMPPALQNTAVIMAGVGGAALLAASGAARLKTASSGALESLAALGPRGERAAASLDKAGKVAGRAAIAFAALQVGGALVSSFIDDLNPQIEAATAGLEEWNRQTRLAGEAARLFGDDAEDLSRALSSTAGSGFSQVSDSVTDFVLGIGGVASPLDDAKERVAAFDQALTRLVQDGHAQEAGAIIAEMAERSGLSIDQVLAKLPGYTGALELAARGADGTAAAQTKAAATADLLTGGWEGAAKAVKGLIAAHEGLTAGLLGNVDAQIAFQAAIDEAAEGIPAVVKGLKAHEDAVTNDRRALDLNTKAGREVAAMLRETVDTTIEATQAKYDETQSVEEARKVYETGRAELVKQMVQAGLTKEAARLLAEQWLKMPDVVPVDIQVTGGKAAVSEAVAEMQREANRYRLSIPTQARTIGGGTSKAQRWGGIDYAMATGGTLGAFIADSPTVLMGERATNREAYIPENGDHARNLRTLATAAAWEGHRVIPAGQGSANAKVSLAGMVLEAHIEVGGEVVRVVRTELREHDRGVVRRARAGTGRR